MLFLNNLNLLILLTSLTASLIRSDSPKLNDRAAQLVGRQFTLEKSVEGQEKVQVGDTFWTVESDCNIGSGTQVRVIDTKGMTLVIEALNEDSPTDDVVA